MAKSKKNCPKCGGGTGEGITYPSYTLTGKVDVLEDAGALVYFRSGLLFALGDRNYKFYPSETVILDYDVLVAMHSILELPFIFLKDDERAAFYEAHPELA